ncbi:hypothetical protein D477_001389 [Arthrobacter crystallopoietes BAB-32]|uniref:Uncharacterized protein n=1 Tax=Arthrobacter crystallopoietes BAB-32 TaxID=1246476 RepID=N1V3R9_9MICC|nr:phospholipase D-like domain-containing protein [Arthrobacter crystallopoietes]EMY36000.1 hypothetical protein D477_001389 [Arthrobacter crystallopoietes BAB-32]
MGIESQLHTKAAGWLRDAIQAIDGNVVLASPYLTIEVCKQLASAAKDSRYSWQLLTCLDPSAVANGYLSLKGIEDLMGSGVRVRHVPRLHAKAYLFGTRGLVGSANLTGAGLGSSASSNFELGISLTPDQVADAKRVVTTWPARDVTLEDLSTVLTKARDLTSAHQMPSDDLDADSALHFAERLLSDARDGRGLWVKLEYGEPKLGGWCQQSLFASPAKGRPGFKPGDLVFICAAATGDCYAVVEVTSEAEFKPSDYLASREQAAVERWPWINRTKPRLVPSELMALKLDELGANKQALQNGHVRLKLDQFAAGVRALARLATDQP